MPATALPSSRAVQPHAARLRCAQTRACAARRVAPRAAAGSVVVPPAWPGRAEAPAVAKQSWAGPKPISLIGSTGSIGTQTLDIVGEFPEQYKVVALSAGSNVALLAEQARPPCGAACGGARRSAAPLPLLSRATYLQRARTLRTPALTSARRSQVRKFKPSLVSISDASKVGQLKELIKDVQPQPESAAASSLAWSRVVSPASRSHDGRRRHLCCCRAPRRGARSNLLVCRCSFSEAQCRCPLSPALWAALGCSPRALPFVPARTFAWRTKRR